MEWMAKRKKQMFFVVGEIPAQFGPGQYMETHEI
jgi:hypothetical protein